MINCKEGANAMIVGSSVIMSRSSQGRLFVERGFVALESANAFGTGPLTAQCHVGSQTFSPTIATSRTPTHPPATNAANIQPKESVGYYRSCAAIGHEYRSPADAVDPSRCG